MADAFPETVAGKATSKARWGTFVAVVGPSGAGKDTLIAGARQMLAAHHRIVFVTRMITRPVDPSEPYLSISREEFDSGVAQGQFALDWQANGLCYALPGSTLHSLSSGKLLVANLSREVVPLARERFPSMLVVHVTASLETLRARIASRGRESEEERELRIARSMVLEHSLRADVRISNDGPPEEAVNRFVSILLSLEV